MFENKLLKRIFGPKREEVTSEWRKLHDEELNDLYCTQNIVRVIKSNKNEMGGTCSAYGEEDWRIQGFRWGNLRERDHMKYLHVDGKIVLK